MNHKEHDKMVSLSDDQMVITIDLTGAREGRQKRLTPRLRRQQLAYILDATKTLYGPPETPSDD